MQTGRQAKKATTVKRLADLSDTSLGKYAARETNWIAWWSKCNTCNEMHEDDNPLFVCRICGVRVRCHKCAVGAVGGDSEGTDIRCALTVAGTPVPGSAEDAEGAGVGWLGPTCCKIGNVFKSSGNDRIYYTYKSVASDSDNAESDDDHDDIMTVWADDKVNILNMEPFLPSDGPAATEPPSAPSLESFEANDIIEHVRRNPELRKLLQASLSE